MTRTVGVGMPAVSKFRRYEDRCRFETYHCCLYRCGPGRFTALVARPNAQQLLPEHPARHARRESHRRLYHRASGCILPVQRSRAGVAVVRHYWLLWWSDHILNLLLRWADPASVSGAYTKIIRRISNRDFFCHRVLHSAWRWDCSLEARI